MRNLSTTAKQALFDQETGEVFVILLEIDHADLEEPIRVNSSGQLLTHDGEDYQAFPFELVLPEDSDGINSRAKLRIDNIDRRIVQAVREATNTAMDVHFKIVLGSSPDTVEADFPDFKLRNISYDKNIVEGDLMLEDFTSEPYPAGTFTPALFPGLF